MRQSLFNMTVQQLEKRVMLDYKAIAVPLSPKLDNALFIPARADSGPIVALIAHTDTVFDRPLLPDEIGRKGNVVYSKHDTIGLGADDRAGVSACLDLYDRLDNVAVILCPNEETGCQGSRALSRDIVGRYIDLDRLAYCLQFDRRGSRDIVTYDVADDSFVGYLESNLIGYSYAHGSYSDIAELCPTLGIMGANLSIGYRNEHTSRETLDLLDYQRTVDIVFDMLSTSDIERFDLIQSARDQYEGYGYWGDIEDDYFGGNDPSDLLSDMLEHIYGSDDTDVSYDPEYLADLADMVLSDLESGVGDIERDLGPVYDAYDLIGDDDGLRRSIELANALHDCRSIA